MRNVARECLLVLEDGIMGLKGGWNNEGEVRCDPLEVGSTRNRSLWLVLCSGVTDITGDWIWRG